MSLYSVLVRMGPARLYLPGVLVCMGILLVGCSGLALGGGAASGPPSATAQANVPLSRLHWCGKPLMVFRDLAAPAGATPTPGATPASTPTGNTTTTGGLGPANGTPTTIKDWSLVRENLGFTVFLPATLPAGSCLMSASGSLRDPILGSNFSILYLLPDNNSLSLSQAPQRSQNTTFQCSVSPTTGGASAGQKGATPAATAGKTPVPVQLCSGVRDKTNIVFSTRGTTPTLQGFFRNLQSGVDWIPSS